MSEKKIVICDIDGTIANNDHRQHFLEGKKDWDGFFSELLRDKPMYSIIEKVKNLHFDGKNIAFITGRPDRYRAETVKWLNLYFEFEYLLLMRKNNDKRNKLMIKKELFENNFSPSEIVCCFENDRELIKLWKQIDIKVVDINEIIN